jgi:tetratricopeptide (TPR) repeat protein
MLVATGDVTRDGDRYRLTGDLDRLAVPDSLQAVIGARLDRLEAAERDLVQDAAVLGQTFPLEGLQALRGGSTDEIAGAMRDLVRRELFEINEDPRSPERGQYSFVQSVVREVAYGRLSRADRYEAHLRVAEYFEGLDEPELAIAVASHLLAARDSSSGDDSAFVDRALEALGRAADRALSLHAHDQVLRLCDQATAMAEADGQRAPFWLRAAESSARLADIDVAAEFGMKAVAHAEAAGDRIGRMRAARLTASLIGSAFRADEALDLLRPVYDDLDAGDDSDDAVRLLAEMGRLLMLNGDDEGAVPVCDRALSIAEAREMTDIIVDALITKGTALGNSGRRQEAIVILDGAAALAEEHELLRSVVRATNNLSVILQGVDPLASAHAADRRSAMISRIGDRGWELQLAHVMAVRAANDGEFSLARERIAVFDEDDTPAFFRATREVDGGWLDVMEGREGGIERIERGLEIWGDTSDAQLSAQVEILKADVDRLRGDYVPAVDRASATIETVHTMWAVRSAIVAVWQTGDRERVRAVRDLFERCGVVGRYPRAFRSWLDGIDAALGGAFGEAAEAFVAAVDLLQQVSPGLDVLEAQISFAELVGDAHPAAGQAREAAAAWVRRTGARFYEARYPNLFIDAARDRTGTA